MWNEKKQTAPSYPTQPYLTPVPVNETWYERNQKNKPQSNSVGAGALILISGGMNMSWRLGFEWGTTATSPGFPITDSLLCSWFIGVIIGAIIGAAAYNLIHKKLITCIASLLVAISGALLVAISANYAAVMAARYVNGIAVGMIFPLTFALGSEQIVKQLRGMVMSSLDAMCVSLGIFLQMMYASFWTQDIGSGFDELQLMGCLNILWGVIGFIIAFTLQKESPIYYLARGQEEQAIDVIRRLQIPYIITTETYEQFEEHKRYLAESKEISFGTSVKNGLPALCKLCVYRAFAALTFSYLSNFAFSYATSVAEPLQCWPSIVYGVVRYVSAFILMFFMDKKGRKGPMTIGMLLCTVIAFVVAVLYDDSRNYFNVDYMAAAQYLLICYQFFAVMSVISTSVYLCEAFPLAVKTYYIAIVIAVEMLVHIIIICSRKYLIVFNVFKISEYFYTLGSLHLIFFFVAKFAMPETKLDTLREALRKFKNF